MNVSDTLLKLRVSEKPSQSENSAGGYLEGGYSEGGYSKGGYSEGGDSEGDSEREDSTEALLSIIVSFIYKNEAILTFN